MKQVALILIASALSPQTFADNIELKGGLGAWRADFSGDVGQYGQTTSLENLGISGEDNDQFWFSIEHDASPLPQFRISYSHISVEKISRIKQEITIGDLFIRGDINIDVLTDLNLSHTDFTAYYEFIDSIIEIDLGATARYFQGYVEIETEINAPYRWDLSGTVPMFFGRGHLSIPGTSFSLEGIFNGMSYDGNTIIDTSFSLRWLSGRLGVATGYRQMILDVEDFNGFTADAKAAGPFAEFVVKI